MVAVGGYMECGRPFLWVLTWSREVIVWMKTKREQVLVQGPLPLHRLCRKWTTGPCGPGFSACCSFLLSSPPKLQLSPSEPNICQVSLCQHHAACLVETGPFEAYDVSYLQLHCRRRVRLGPCLPSGPGHLVHRSAHSRYTMSAWVCGWLWNSVSSLFLPLLLALVHLLLAIVCISISMFV
jgi:hypothetical protein